MLNYVMLIIKKLDKKAQFAVGKKIFDQLMNKGSSLVKLSCGGVTEEAVMNGNSGQIALSHKIRKALGYRKISDLDGVKIAVTINVNKSLLSIEKINIFSDYNSSAVKICGVNDNELVRHIINRNKNIIQISNEYRIKVTFYQVLLYINVLSRFKRQDIISILATDAFDVEKPETILKLLSYDDSADIKSAIIEISLHDAGVDKILKY